MKIDKKWKLATGVIAGLSVNAVMAKILTNALDGKGTIVDAIGAGLISGFTAAAVSNETLKLMNAIEETFTSEEDENTTEETEPTDEVAEES
jgi:ribosomal protein L12E/L44/L45/RPP1/RPP2